MRRFYVSLAVICCDFSPLRPLTLKIADAKLSTGSSSQKRVLLRVICENGAVVTAVSVMQISKLKKWNNPMKTEYDPKADAIYIRLIAGTVGIRVRFQLLKAAVHDKGLRQAVWAGLHRTLD